MKGGDAPARKLISFKYCFTTQGIAFTDPCRKERFARNAPSLDLERKGEMVRRMENIDTVQVPRFRIETEPINSIPRNFDLDKRIERVKNRNRDWLEFWFWFLIGMALSVVAFVAFIGFYSVFTYK